MEIVSYDIYFIKIKLFKNYSNFNIEVNGDG